MGRQTVSTRRALVALATVSALAGGPLAGCGDDAVELVNGVEEHVDTVDNAFQPGGLSVQAGTEVVFRNLGRNEHNVVPVDEDQHWIVDDEDFGAGDEATRRLTEPGTFDYYCSIHGTAEAGMVGTITVEG